MMNKLVNHDSIQNTVIAFLCVVTVLLLCKTLSSSLFPENIEKVFTNDNSANTVSSVGSPLGNLSAEPQYIVVTSKGRTHYTSKFSDERSDLSGKFSAMLGEALGSAKSPKEITENEWKSYLQSEGVLFDYVFPQSLGFASITLGTNCSSEIDNVMARRMLLGIDGNKLYLCYIDESNGKFYRCETAPSAVSLSSKIDECPIGDAKYAFEHGDQYSNIDPYFIFTNESIRINDITSINPIGNTAITSTLLGYFGVNESTSSHLIESTGSQAFVENSKSLRVEPDGNIVFTAESKNGIQIKYSGNSPSLTDVLSTCGKLALNVASYFGVDATFGVTGITRGSDTSSYDVSFGQFVDGIPVSVSGTPGVAVFSISNGAIVRVEILLRSYTVSALDTTTPLPEVQMAAIITKKGGEPVLMYSDDGGTNPVVSWILKS